MHGRDHVFQFPYDIGAGGGRSSSAIIYARDTRQSAPSRGTVLSHRVVQTSAHTIGVWRLWSSLITRGRMKILKKKKNLVRNFETLIAGFLDHARNLIFDLRHPVPAGLKNKLTM